PGARPGFPGRARGPPVPPPACPDQFTWRGSRSPRVAPSWLPHSGHEPLRPRTSGNAGPCLCYLPGVSAVCSNLGKPGRDGMRERLMAQRMDQAADGGWLVAGTDGKWVLVAEGDEVTLVDTGEPRDLPWVLSSLERIGRALGDVRAVVLTHAHPDHIGAAERLRADRGIPARLLAAEAPHARGQVIEEAPTLPILRIAWRPQVLAWVLRILRAGATRAERLTEVEPFEAGSGPLDVPGRLVPVPTPGHTSGHWAFHLPGRGVIIAGDALITAH